MFHPLVLVTWFVYTAPEVGAVQRCLHYSQPKNGRIVCDSLFKLFCAPECAPGHVFAFRPAVVYMCGPVNGEWYTYPPGHALPWPDCVKETGNFENNVMKEVNAKRMEISKRIPSTQNSIFPKRYTSASQQSNRYQHLYKYVERARQVYQKRQKTPEYVTSERGREPQETGMENRGTQGYLENVSNKFSSAYSSDASQHEVRDTRLVNQNQNASNKFSYAYLPNANQREMQDTRLVNQNQHVSNKFSDAYLPNANQREMRDTELEKANQIKSYRKNAWNKFSVSVNSSPSVNQREMQDTRLVNQNQNVSNRFSDAYSTNVTQREMQDTELEKTTDALEIASNTVGKPVNLSNGTQREIQEAGLENRVAIDSPYRESYLENASRNKFSTPLAYSSTEKQPTGKTAPVQSELADQTPTITRITGKGFNTTELTKGEKLFYFPIKRDALIKMLPKDLHEKYVDLQQSTAKQTGNPQKRNLAQP